MTESFDLVMKSGSYYKHYSNCTVDGVFAHCNECDFKILAIGHFTDDETKQIRDHLKKHGVSVSYSMRAEKITEE